MMQVLAKAFWSSGRDGLTGVERDAELPLLDSHLPVSIKCLQITANNRHLIAESDTLKAPLRS
jgi:hypothetical protein